MKNRPDYSMKGANEYLKLLKKYEFEYNIIILRNELLNHKSGGP